MIVIGAFRHSLDLEQALSVLERSGIPRKQLLVVAMDGEPDVPMPYSSRTKDLHSQGVELGFACATGLAVIGASTGFIAPWGPILGGLAAAILGFGIGFGTLDSRQTAPSSADAEEPPGGDRHRPVRGTPVAARAGDHVDV